MDREQQSIRTTYQYKLTPEQERMLERTLTLCRHRYHAAIGNAAIGNAAIGNAAIGDRREAWRMCGVRVTYYQQQAERPGIKEALPAYAEGDSQVLQDVVRRVDHAFQAFFRRVKAGETPGYPRFQGRDRYHSLTYPQVGEHGGAALDGGIENLPMEYDHVLTSVAINAPIR